MTDFFEIDEKQKTVKLLNLDDFSVEDLKKYISELQIEIERVREEVSNKKNLKLPGTNLVNKNMKKCNQDGHSEKDSSSYYYIVKKENK